MLFGFVLFSFLFLFVCVLIWFVCFVVVIVVVVVAVLPFVCLTGFYYYEILGRQILLIFLRSLFPFL